MSLHRPSQTKRRFWAGSIVLVLAIAVLGLGGGRQATAQFDDPRKLLELIKKKGNTKAVTGAKQNAGNKKQLPGFLRGKKGATKTAVPKNLQRLPGRNQPGKNLFGKGPNGNAGKTTISKATKGNGKLLNNQFGSKNAKKGTFGNIGNGKNAKSAIGKAGKGTGNRAAFGKGIGRPKANSIFGKGNLPKGIARRGFNTRTVLRGPLRAATPVERLRLRTDHRRELLAVRRLLPVRPLPGQRGFTAVPPAGETRLVRSEMVFRVGPNVSPQALQAAMRRHGLTTIGSENIGLAGGTLYHFRITGGQQVAAVIRALETENLGVPSANYTYRLFQQENDQQEDNPKEDDQNKETGQADETNQTDLAARSGTGATEQYVVSKLHLGEVHKVATGRGVLVAVIDSAIDVNHPDLAGAIAEQYNAVGRREKPHFHGTGMVGAIVAHRRLLGIAPGARILAIQAFSGSRQSPEATTRQILAGLEWAVRKGARVINMSFAGPYDPLLALAMKNAHAKGVVLIAAAGNLGPKSPPLYPAADPNVIAVTAVDENDHLFSQAVRGPHVAVAAPGVDVMVPAPERTYQLTTGTSVAAAHVSGVAALLIERYPNVDAATVLEVLTATAKKLDPKGRDNEFGWGLIDPASALAELESRIADNKIASASAPTSTPQQAPAPRPPSRRQATPQLAPASAQ